MSSTLGPVNKCSGMDNVQDFEKAIICSIVERSLDKMNDYFERPSCVAKHLNSNILSILLTLLEKEDISNEENVVKVKCVLHGLNKFLDFKQNSSTWEHLSEDISKICELCFCISLNNNDKELIELNIRTLDQMIQVNRNLTNHIFGYLLGPCLTALSIYCRSSDNTLLFTLSNFTSSLCENASRMKRNEIVPTVTHHLNTLSDLLTLCGDYETQAAIVEVLARCKSSIVPSMTSLGSNEKLNLFSRSKKLREEFNKYSFVKFDPECRLFLSALNTSLGDKRKVYSVPSICLVHNGITLKKPKDPSYKSFWVDFNMVRKRITFYHELPDTNWTIECIPFQEVVNVIAKNSVCTTKRSNQNIDSVKVEFTLCKNKTVLQRIELLKIYCHKTQFDLLHRVLTIVFCDMYTCDIDVSLKTEIGLAHNVPASLGSSIPFKEISNPGKTNKPFSLHASKSDEIGLPLSKQSRQQNVIHITSPTEKLNNRREGVISKGVNLNPECSPNVDHITKESCRIDKNKFNIRPEEVICIKHENNSNLVNNAIEKSPEMLKHPSLIDKSSSKQNINDNSKDPIGYTHHNTKERTVKRKRLYSFDNEDIYKSIVLSSQDEQQPLNVKEIPNKKLMIEGKHNEKNSFWDKNTKHRKIAGQKDKHCGIFTDKNSSDYSIPHLDYKTSNHVTSKFSNKEIRESEVSDKSIYNSKRVDNKLLALNRIPESATISNLFAKNVFSDLSACSKATLITNPKRNTYTRRKGKKPKSLSLPSSSDSDYKPTCDIKITECKVPNKRILRKRNKPFNKVDVIDKSKSNKSEKNTNNETNKDSPVPKKLKDNKSCIGEDKLANNNLEKSDTNNHLPTSYTNESNFPLKTRFKGSQGFLNTIVLSRPVDPTRDDTFYNDIEMNAIQPEDSKTFPDKIMTTHEARCEIEDQSFVLVDLDLTNSKDFTIFDELSVSKSKLESKTSAKGKPMNSWNMKVEVEMPVKIHNESFCHGMNLNLIQSKFKVDDMLEFSQKSVLNLKNNIKSSLIQSEEKRQQNLDDHGLQLNNTRHSILEHCERLEVNCSKLNELKASLGKTLELQHDLIIKIQSEMANLEEAKEQLFKKEAEVKNSEAFNIMNIFKNIGTYVKRLLFTSFRESPLTS